MTHINTKIQMSKVKTTECGDIVWGCNQCFRVCFCKHPRLTNVVLIPADTSQSQFEFLLHGLFLSSLLLTKLYGLSLHEFIAEWLLNCSGSISTEWMTHCAMMVYTGTTLGYSLKPFVTSLSAETKTGNAYSNLILLQYLSMSSK